MNKTIIVGNLTRDAVLEKVKVDGKPTSRCKFKVAVNERRGNGAKITTFFAVTLWYEQAERLAPWLLKGRKVLVEGSVRLNQYTDSRNAVHSELQLHNIEDVKFLDKKPETSEPEVNAEELEELPDEFEEDEDEFPFD